MQGSFPTLSRTLLCAGITQASSPFAHLNIFALLNNQQSCAQDANLAGHLLSEFMLLFPVRLNRLNSNGLRYALDIDLPDCVVEHHTIQELNRWTNDLVAWSNVRLLRCVSKR